MPVGVTTLDVQGRPALQLQNEHASLVVLPELGGKIVSLRSSISGTEFLWQDPSRPYRTPQYGDDFGNYDASGWDECFPSIGACAYPAAPWSGSVVPDHGELWSIPWHAEQADDTTLYLHTYGVRFPYHFEKWIRLVPDAAGFTLRYRVTNLSPFPFPHLWSAHPLFAAEEGMRILLPGTPNMRLQHVIGERGISGDVGDEYTWPWLPSLSGHAVDYREIGSPALDANDKVVLDAPPEGWCALYRPHSGEYVGLTFTPDEIPFVGICVNHGGWPFTGARGFWVAVEPCTGWPDRLDQAVPDGAVATLPAGQTVEWKLDLRIGHADTADDVGRQLVQRRVSTPMVCYSHVRRQAPAI